MTACLYTWTNSNDPDDQFFWHSAYIPECPTCSGGNLPAYFHPYNFQAEIDDLTARAARLTDQEERKQLYWQIQEVLHREEPCIFIFWPKYFAAVANNVGGFWPSAYNSLMWNAAEWYLTT
jgi:ABC-type transport system substrate-binding protein